MHVKIGVDPILLQSLHNGLQYLYIGLIDLESGVLKSYQSSVPLYDNSKDDDNDAVTTCPSTGGKTSIDRPP